MRSPADPSTRWSVWPGTTKDLEARAGPDHPILVVGAGPVGMFTALCLARRGIAVRIVDQYRRAALHSYALALHPGTLRLLNEFGLADLLVGHGHVIDRIALYRGSTRAATLDLSPVKGDFPFVLVLPQSILEGALERCLEDSGVPVAWNRQVLAFDGDDQGVTALVGDRHQTERVRASVLIGADGDASPTRRWLGEPIETAGPPLLYGLVEFESAIERPGEMSIVFDHGSTDVLWPMGAERGRWGLQLPDSRSEPDSAGLRKLVARRAPWFGGDFGPAAWLASVRFQPKLLRRFGRGRVWLVGDATHATSPVGVQSMNIGMREAHELARCLSEVLAGRRPSRLLYRYSDERHQEWRILLGQRGGLLARPGADDWARGLGGRLIGALPASRGDLNTLLGQLGLRLE